MDWLKPMILLLPLAAWMFGVVGIPWALALLPRRLWRERVTVIAVGMALGPVGVTAVMFVLGLAGVMTLAAALAGGTLLAAIGAGIAWRRRGEPDDSLLWLAQDEPLLLADRLLIAGIVVVLLVGVVITAYWPFLAYDSLWVYGHNAKIFVMEEAIPAEMDYYPPLVPLSYALMQQAWGSIDDHAARAVVPWFNTASVLMAYVLGRRVFRSRRVGLLTAAIWALYPHMAAWFGGGDLEIVLTLYTTGAAAFFIEAWRSENRRVAVLSGLLLAGAFWTKPTGGALALGVGLVMLGWWAHQRFAWAALGEKLRIALIAGAATVPIGGMWYARNLLLGHEVVTFPASYWHDFAQRSGQEFGWPLLIAGLVALALVVHPPARLSERSRVVRWGLPLAAVALLLAGTLPTALGRVDSLHDVWLWVRGDLGAAGRMGWLEWVAVVAGFGLLAWLGRDRWRRWPEPDRETVLLLWGLMLPYAVVWFLNFSYHFRLSFAIVPLAAVQVAALVADVVWPRLSASLVGGGLRAAAIVGLVVLTSVVGIEFTADAWRDGGLPDDTAKYDRGNPALMTVVHALEDVATARQAVGLDTPPVVVIPGEDRLPFFFPTWDIRVPRTRESLPTTVEDLAGADVFVNTSSGRFLLQEAGLWPNELQAQADLALVYHREGVVAPDGSEWPTVLDPIPLSPDGSLPVDDGNFRYEMYTVHPEARQQPVLASNPPPGEVQIGDFAAFMGHDLVSLAWHPGEWTTFTLWWRPTAGAPPPQDYSIFLHAIDPATGEKIAGWDGPPMMGTYTTRFWQPGETLLDYRKLEVPPDMPPGPIELRIGVYDPITGERVPITVDGVPVPDNSLVIETRVVIQ